MNRVALSACALRPRPVPGKACAGHLVRRAVFAISVSHRRNHAMPADRELHFLLLAPHPVGIGLPQTKVPRNLCLWC
jgi:hypothetical protein